MTNLEIYISYFNWNNEELNDKYLNFTNTCVKTLEKQIFSSGK